MRVLICLAVGVGLLMQMGCASPMTQTEQSTVIGSGLGAAMGMILGHNLGGSRNDRELGAAAGAILGGVIGNQYGTTREMQQQVNYMQQQQFITTVWVENGNGSKTPVQLRMTEGGQYIGPRGEYYSTMPTQEQLKKVYSM
jgi:uncharacterized protein YcfJ